MDIAELTRARSGRWSVSSDEVVWVFEMDRGAAWSRWGLMVGASVRAWMAQEAVPRANDCHVVVDYAVLGSSGVPQEAVGTRFGDHRSYFTMMFDHTHELVPADERSRSFEFMAQDVARLAREHATVSSLRQAVAEGDFDSGFVDPRLR